jgi:hypothetical protein
MYELNDFTSLEYTGKFQAEYKMYEHPAYETFCWQVQKYMPEKRPEEIIDEMCGVIRPQILEIFDAVKEGNLPRLKAVHYQGQTLQWHQAYEPYTTAAMKLAMLWKRLDVVYYYYERENICNRALFEKWNFTEDFPLLKELAGVSNHAEPEYVTKDDFDRFRLQTACKNQLTRKAIVKSRKKMERIIDDIIEHIRGRSTNLTVLSDFTDTGSD